MKLNEIIDTARVSLKNAFGGRTVSANQKKYDTMYDVSDVFKGWEYWRTLLFAKTIGMFEYTGLPDTIPASALEKMLITHGKCAIVPRGTNSGELYAVPLNENGVGYYPDFPPSGVWATPKISGNGDAFKDYCPIYANSVRMPMNDIINRYARILADIESTLICTAYNIRRPTYYAADNETTADSYIAARIANRLGQDTVIFDSNLIQNIRAIPAAENIDSNALTQIFAARENALKAFLSELGIQYTTDKREYVSVEQVRASNQMLIVNVADMLTTRQDSLNALNKMYNLNVSVKLNPAYDLLTMVEKEMKTSDDNTLSDEKPDGKLDENA